MPELGWGQSLCFEPFRVPYGTTLDFSASLSTPGAFNAGHSAIAKMYLYNQTGEAVARNESTNHPENVHSHHSVSLIHTDKVWADTDYTFCI